MLPNTMKFVRSTEFSPLAQVIQTELVQTGRLRLALGGLLRLIKVAPPPPGLLAPVEKLEESEVVDPLVKLLSSGASYIAGEAPANKSHYEVTTVLGKTLMECDQSGPLAMVEKLFSTRLPLGCTGSENGCKLAIRALIIPVRNLLANPLIRTLLGLFNVSSIPSDGFVSLIKLFTSIFSNDVLDFSRVRMVVQTNVLPFITDKGLHDAIDELVTVLDQFTSPEVGVQKALVSTIKCFEAHDTNSELYRMAYVLVSDPSFQTIELLSAVDATTDLDPQGSLTDWVAHVVQFLRADKATNDAIIGMVGVLLEERNVSRVLPTVLKMGDQGVVDDLRSLLTRDSCR